MKLGYVLISVLFISFGLSWLPAQAGQDDSVRIRGPIGTDEAEIQQNAEVYGPVTRSDTLWGIATQVRPDTNVTLAQVMIALLHANPHAFLDNNPNALESGFMLRIPGEEEIRAVDAETARRQIEEGAPAQPRSARQPAANNAQNAVGQPAQMQAGQQERTQQASPSPTVQLVTEDRPPQGTTVAATGDQTDVNDIDALRDQLARSIENTERVLAENAALRARLQGISQSIDDIERTMVADEDFQQQIRQLLDEQQPRQVVDTEPEAAGLPQSILQNPWALILLTFVPALVLITIASLVLRRKPSPSPETQAVAGPQQEPDTTTVTSDAEPPTHDDFELDEAMAEFDDLDDEGDDLAALEDEMLVPVEKDDDSISLDDDLDDLNDLDLSDFDTLDDELDDEFNAGEANEESSFSRDTLLESDSDDLIPTDSTQEKASESDHLNQAELDSLFTASENTTDDDVFLESDGSTTQATSDDALFEAVDSDEETNNALQELEDEEDFDFDRMVEQFADDEENDLDDDDIEALLAKSDQLVGAADAMQISAAVNESETSAEATETPEGDTPSQQQSDKAKYIDIDSILAEADAEPVDDEDEPQSEDSRRADAEDNLAAKLDLARAYLEMGEQNEARETIESVIKQASGELLDEANELLSRFDS